MVNGLSTDIRIESSLLHRPITVIVILISNREIEIGQIYFRYDT